MYDAIGLMGTDDLPQLQTECSLVCETDIQRQTSSYGDDDDDEKNNSDRAQQRAGSSSLRYAQKHHPAENRLTPVLLSLALQMSDGAHSALARFLDSSQTAVTRRGARNRMRAHRAAMRKGKVRNVAPKKKSTWKHCRKRLPCCGQERRQCCCGADIDHMFCQESLQSLVNDIKSRDVLTAHDPKDMAYIMSKLKDRRISIHGFWFHCALFRIYSNPDTYKVLGKHAGALQPSGRAPDWSRMRTTLAELYAKGSVFGGLFYPMTLRAVKSRDGGWRTFSKLTSPIQKAQRDVLVFKIIWQGITAGAAQPGEALTEYFKCRKQLSTDHTFEAYQRARAAFATFYDGLDAHMHSHTKGVWGDYTSKLLLDVACNVSLTSIKDNSPVCPDGILSRWPVHCPAYGPALKRLLKRVHKKKKLHTTLRRQLLMRVHAHVSARLGANNHNLSTTLAQLCWQKRDNA